MEVQEAETEARENLESLSEQNCSAEMGKDRPEALPQQQGEIEKTSQLAAGQAGQGHDNKQEGDEDLAKLLNSALEDFGKSTRKPPAIVEDPPDEDLPPIGSNPTQFFDQKMAQQAAAEFQNMLRQLAEVQKVVLDQAKAENLPASSASPSMGEGDGPPLGSLAEAVAGLGPAPGAPTAAGFPPDDETVAQALLQNLQNLAEKAGKVTDASSEEDFMEAMQDLHTNTEYENDFLPFMQELMGSLLSKEMMYPSLKEMAEKYPVWLEENEPNLSQEDSERYRKQLSLIQAACQVYEAEKEDDTDEVLGERFEKLIHIMQQMQLCGQPPEALVGSMPPGWGLDESTGLPKVVDSQQAAESCSIM